MTTEVSENAAPGPRALCSLEIGLVALATVSILAITVIIFFGVVTRAVFHWSIPDSEIIVRDLMIITFVSPLSFVGANRMHIAVNVLADLFPKGIQTACDLLASIIGFLVVLMIAYGGWKGLNSVWANNAYFFGEFDLPEWPGKLAFFVGFTVFAIRLFSLILLDLNTLFRSRAKNASSR